MSTKRSSADQALACALRRLRQARGSTQEELAYNAGITVTSLARIERGEVNPGWTMVRRVIDALEIDLAGLVAAVEDPQSASRHSGGSQE